MSEGVPPHMYLPHGSRNACTFVHAHVQFPVKAERESPFAVVKVVGRDAEISQYSVYLSDIVIT